MCIRDRNRRVRAKRIYADMQRNARYSEVLPADQLLVQVQQERKNKLTTHFEPTTVYGQIKVAVQKHYGNEKSSNYD